MKAYICYICYIYLYIFRKVEVSPIGGANPFIDAYVHDVVNCIQKLTGSTYKYIRLHMIPFMVLFIINVYFGFPSCFFVCGLQPISSK